MTLVFFCFMSTTFKTFSELRLSLDSIFSGLLALTGFVFTARTFITFKLNDMIYGNPEYRIYVEKLKKEGAYKRELYDPLKTVDGNLGTATYMCLWATILFIIVAFFPKPITQDLGNRLKADFVHEVLGNLYLTEFISPKYLLPLAYKLFTDATMVYFGFCLYQMVITAKSLHKNISDIVARWEAEYNETPKVPQEPPER